MDRALRAAVRARLRPAGFTGSLPHLRRITEEQICLLSVQFSSAGGSFAVEVGECPPEGLETHRGFFGPAEVTSYDLPLMRPRVGSVGFPDGDHWFVFGTPSWEPDEARPSAHYDAVAAEALAAVERQAEPFWREQLAIRQRR